MKYRTWFLSGVTVALAMAATLCCAESKLPAAKERIVYAISPAGRSEYNDRGTVMLDGREVRVATFRTQVLGFQDLETIYTDPVTLLPIRVLRDISMWFKKEYIVEDYDQKTFRLVIKKYKNKKVVEEHVFRTSGPIQNAVILPFTLRREPKIGPGWHTITYFPLKFEVRLVGIEEIRVPAGTFKAFHFTSVPYKFDIWISDDAARVPVRIKGASGLGYTLEMAK